MGPHKADAHAKPEKPTQDLSLINSQKLLSVPPVSLRLRVLPWWFPVQELSNPMVFYLESWVAERIIGEILTPGVWVNSLYSFRGSKGLG